ncbi:uncharacterized protein T551_00956 [Pneumocystis jirovecii RU7]|uniref:Peptidyl-tRNA hydrolase n=1 Tax=Pneumocystis jirovecii (strain RU7) TaxID=1408657 RepID=A0A0W4ZTI5_PNEJ7|nr:uncharacterized protein T551_00956 [Pneumocystis jirovecii RU7]KTW31695.1 hypothetical protein T551_00956 [Pneumocystis jirovecii RU7]
MRCQFICSQRFLICSLGNPGAKYRFTRHSLGHYVLEQIHSYFGFSVFEKDPSCFGMYAKRDDLPFLLFQSCVFMNESGKAVQKAWNKFCADMVVEGEGRPLLVVLHDDIEEKFGTVKVREQGKGRYNFVIDVWYILKNQEVIKAYNRVLNRYLLRKSFVRFSIGLGRPSTRESKDVVNFVLQKLSPQELSYINEITVPKVIEEIEKLKDRVKSE